MLNDYSIFYEQLTKNIRNNRKKIQWINRVNWLITKLIYILYPILLVNQWIKMQDYIYALPYLVVPATGFVLLSVIRRKIDYPRPYETWNITPLIDRSDKKGESFPSRHVFSATIISMCFLHINRLIGIILLILSSVLAYCRVIGGVHYPKDVIVGFIIGFCFGSLLFWI